MSVRTCKRGHLGHRPSAGFCARCGARLMVVRTWLYPLMLLRARVRR